MTKRISKFLFVVSVVAVAGCSSRDGRDGTASQTALTTSNGLAQNGLTTNGLVSNGFWSNGFWSNGFWSNGFWSNGFWSNGFWSNGFWSNGFWSNGLGSNGFWSNGFWSNGFWSNGLTGADAVPGDILRSNVYARQLLQYIYSCAMPATTYDTKLDPNDLTPLACTADTDCEGGYSCLDNKCVIPLRGGGAHNSGLAINEDGTTWWGQPAPGGPTDLTSGKWGQCDETCQRWVSACVLARTNAYGVHVPISLRAPAGAPQGIREALFVDDSPGGESEVYTLPEGVFYGNIFATKPVNATTGPCTTQTNGDVTCLADGPIANTPQYFACAGPGSNIPAVTNRFCSSQGDQAVIKVPGVCVNNTSQNGICVNDVGNPATTLDEIVSCSTGTMAAPLQPTSYSEFIKVYLVQPIATCGNAVCELGETCDSDCHPGTWTRNYDPTFETLQTQIPPLGDVFPNFADYAMAAVSPKDDTIVVVGDTDETVNLDGVSLPSGGNAGVLVKYNPDGSYAWLGRGVRFSNGLTTGTINATGVTVTKNGDIYVVGASGPTLWFTTFDEDGIQGPTHTFPLGSPTVSPGRSISVDKDGNVYIAGFLNGAATFSPTVSLTGSDGHSVFLIKVSPTGTVLHGEIIDGKRYVASLTNDASGNTLITTHQSTAVSGPTLIKKCADPLVTTCADGSMAWAKNFGTLGFFTTAVADSAGNVYAGGSFNNGANFGGGARLVTGFPPTIVKYDRNGVWQWDKQAAITCAPSGCTFGSTRVYPSNISFDRDQNVVLASWGTPSVGGGINFGLATFPTFATSNLFLSAYFPADSGSVLGGTPQWSKYIPGVLGINPRGIAVDSEGRVVVSGTFGGSMVVDDVLLVTPLPVDQNTVNPFIASFGGPPPDLQAPIIGDTTDQAGNLINTVPQDIFVQATKPAGADVFYMPPTAIDDGNAGTSVSCLPPPNSTFPLGPPPVTSTTTTVTCTAADPRGNHATASFTVTVFDKIGPIFSPVHDISVEAPTSAGVTVPYTPPTATDQISGAASVTCTPASGTLFAVGHHTVTCSATDARSNTASVSFSVDVTRPGIGNPCATSTDCAAGINCVDGVCCETTCGQCYACNTAGALGTCMPTSGGSCNDHDACTQTDTCQAGVCTGSNPVTCSASDQCHVAGACNPATGACSNPAAPNGTACSDGNACTQTDSCQGGTCTGANPVTCSASDQCHVAGTCDPSTGACSNPAAANGTTCSDGNVCTAADVCMAGACVGGGAVTCDDQNPCTVDTCSATGGCTHTPGNAGATCRGAANACDSAEVCTGSSAACPVDSDKMPPTLGPGTNQTIVGNCSGSGVVFAVPPLVSSSCEGGTNVTCTWTFGSSHGTCAKSGSGATVPGNRYGAFTISCTARDAAGNVSSPVVFTVTVLQPLTIKIQPPLSGDNNTVDNIVKLGSTVPNRVKLYACGTDVTRTASVTVKLATAYVSSGGTTTAQAIATCTDAADSNGLMILDGATYRYNLSTKGLSVTTGNPAFYQETITAAYRSAPSVVVGTDKIQLDIK